MKSQLLRLIPVLVGLVSCAPTNKEPAPIVSPTSALSPAHHAMVNQHPVALIQLTKALGKTDHRGEYTSIAHQGIVRATANHPLAVGTPVIIDTFDNGYEKEGYILVKLSENDCSRTADGTLRIKGTAFNAYRAEGLNYLPDDAPAEWRRMRDIVNQK
jgi:hypothetical protein